MSDEFIFVYGTLRKGAATPMSDVLARHCDYFADGLMQGKLFEVNGYPGAIASNNPKETVYGELYRIINSEKIWPLIDDYEGCTDQYPQPHEYLREKRPIAMLGSCISAWVYIFNQDVTGLSQIESGDYLSYLSGKKGNKIE